MQPSLSSGQPASRICRQLLNGDGLPLMVRVVSRSLYDDGADLMWQLADFLNAMGVGRTEFVAETEPADDRAREFPALRAARAFRVLSISSLTRCAARISRLKM